MQEDALAELIKRGSGGGFALASMLSKGSKFNGLDIKRVYFGQVSFPGGCVISWLTHRGVQELASGLQSGTCFSSTHGTLHIHDRLRIGSRYRHIEETAQTGPFPLADP